MAIVLVVDEGIEVVLGRQDECCRPDLRLVDAIARLQLAARRQGWSIRLDEPSAETTELLELVGLPLEAGR